MTAAPDESKATERDATRIHWARLFVAVSALAAAIFAGAKLGTELVELLDTAARGAVEPTQSSASSWQQQALDVTKAVGIDLIRVGLPAVSISVLLAFWTTLANGVNDGLRFARQAVAHWHELLPPAVTLFVAAFTVSTMRAPATPDYVVLLPETPAAPVRSQHVEREIMVGLPAIFFPSGKLRQPRVSNDPTDLTPDGSVLDTAQLIRLVDFLRSTFDDCATADHPVRLEVVGFANARPFSDRRRTAKDSDALNAEQANLRAAALVKALSEALPADAFEVRSGQRWTRIDQLLGAAHDYIAWSPGKVVDANSDLLRMAVVTVSDVGRCAHEIQQVASRREFP